MASSHREGGWRYGLASVYGVGSASNFSKHSLDLNHDEPLYKCSFCTRTFISPQARGGHQNAHKKELAELRRSLKENLENQRAKRARTEVIASDAHVVLSLEIDSSDAVKNPAQKVDP